MRAATSTTVVDVSRSAAVTTVDEKAFMYVFPDEKGNSTHDQLCRITVSVHTVGK